MAFESEEMKTILATAITRVLGALVLERVAQAEPVTTLRADRQQLGEGDHRDERDLAEDVVQLGCGDTKLLCYLRVARAAMQSVLQLGVGLLDLAGLEPHRAWNPVDRSELIDDRALDARDRIGLELDAPLEVVLLDRVDQS